MSHGERVSGAKLEGTALEAREEDLKAIAEALMSALDDAMPAVLGAIGVTGPEAIARGLAVMEGPEATELSAEERSLIERTLHELVDRGSAAADQRPAPVAEEAAPPAQATEALEAAAARPRLPPMEMWIEAALRDERVTAFGAGTGGGVPVLVWRVLCDQLVDGPLPGPAKSSLLWAAAQTARRMQSQEGTLLAAERKRALDRARGDAEGLAYAAELAALVLERQGNTDRALSLRMEDVLPAFAQLGDDRRAVRVLVWVGDQLQERGRMEEALAIRRRELPIREEQGQIMERAVVRTKIADALMARGEHGEAMRLFRDALRVLETAEDPRNQAITLGKIARLLSLSGKHDEALRLRREREIPIYQRLGDEPALAAAAGGVADTLLAQGHVAEGLRVRRDEELAIYERLGDVKQKAHTLGKMADALHLTGRFDEALATYRQAAAMFERSGEERSRFTAETRITDMLERQGHLDEALRRRRDELAVCERTGDERGCAITLAKIAEGLHRQRKSSEALEILLRRVLPLFERLEMLAERAHVLGTVGDILLDGGKAAEALERYRESLPLVQRTGDLRVEGLVLLKLAAAHHALKRHDEAIRILTKEAAPLFRRTGNVRDRATAMQQAAAIHEVRQQLDAAVRILKEDVVGELERAGEEQRLIGERARLALLCLKRNAAGDRALARDLLRRARKAAEARGMPYAQEIRKMQKQFKLEPS